MVESVVQSHAEIVVGSDEKKLIRVLHVDDELGLLKVAKQCLELQGPFHVDTAGSVEEALDKLKEKEYDAVVSDYQMPGKDGLEFLEMLRKNGNTIPFIMFTGKGREEVAVRAWSLGADHYVNKTGDPETVYCELAHCLRSTVEKHFAEAQMKETVQKLQTIYQNAVEGITYVDAEENIVYANKAFADIIGYEQDQLAGMNVRKTVDDENWAKIENETKRRRQGKSNRYEAEFRRRDGTVRNVLISGSPLFDSDGGFAGTVGIVLDVTASKNAEETAKESEEKWHSLFEMAPDGMATTDMKGVITSVNSAFLRLTGYKREDIVGKRFTKLQTIKPKDIPKYLKLMISALRGRLPEPFEYSYARKDGTIGWGEAHVGSLKKNSKTIGYQMIFREITERKKAEEALKDSEEKFRNLAEKSPNMIFINQKGRVVYANRKAEDSMGYTREEFCSPDFNFLDLIAEESKESVKSAFSKHTRGDDVAPREYKLITKEGRTRDAIINSKLIKYDGEPAILGVATDITDRKKDERMTLASQQNFKALFMGNPEAAAHLAPDFHILDVNPRFEELFGYSLAEAKGRHINDVIVPETRMEEAETLDKNAVGGYVYHNTVRKRKDGSLVPVALSAATIMVEGKLAGCIAMYKDISELKNAEKKLETMNEKLRVVGGLTRHDVRNKLSAITGNIYLNKKKSAGNPDVLRSYEDMGSACEQIVRIFDFARDYEMLGVEELTYIDVQKSVKEAVQLFPDLNGVRVLNECHGLTVLSDSLLRQLFYNLIDNSLKYGKKLSQIRIHYEKAEGNQFRLIYEDDGVGVSQDAKPKLFGEGYTTGNGSGYGLYLVKKMMDVYGWTISETGTPGKGVRFTMVMPEKNQNGKENYQLH